MIGSSGFANVSNLWTTKPWHHFLRQHPGMSYDQLARELGGAAPLQVAITQFREARSAGSLRNAIYAKTPGKSASPHARA
jgi:hypothetical protein